MEVFMKMSSKLMFSFVAVLATAHSVSAMMDSMTSVFRNDPVEQKLTSIAKFPTSKDMVSYLNLSEMVHISPESLNEEISQTEAAIKRSQAMTQALKERLTALKKESRERKKTSKPLRSQTPDNNGSKYDVAQ